MTVIVRPSGGRWAGVDYVGNQSVTNPALERNMVNDGFANWAPGSGDDVVLPLQAIVTAAGDSKIVAPAARASVAEAAGGGQLPPYTGFVADRQRSCFSFSATHKYWQGRLGCYAMDDITPDTQMRVVEEGFYTTAAGEQPVGFNAQLMIEYPQGVYTPVTFSGASTGSVPAGGRLVSDPISVTIPRFAKFWYCYYKSNAAGMIYVGGVNIPYSDHDNGDYYEFSATALTNKLGVGGYVNTDVNQGFASPPRAIIGTTSRRTVSIHGDSRSTGLLDHWGDKARHRGMLERSICPYFGNTNASMASETTATLSGSGGALRRQLSNDYASDIVINMGTNDLPSAQTISRLQTLIGQFPGKRVWLCTISPYTTSSDSWATIANQTVQSNEAERVLANKWIRGKPAGVYGVFDIADVVELARSGKWNPLYTSDPSQYTAFEGLHETSLMCQAVAQARVIDPALLGFRA